MRSSPTWMSTWPASTRNIASHTNETYAGTKYYWKASSEKWILTHLNLHSRVQMLFIQLWILWFLRIIWIPVPHREQGEAEFLQLFGCHEVCPKLTFAGQRFRSDRKIGHLQQYFRHKKHISDHWALSHYLRRHTASASWKQTSRTGLIRFQVCCPQNQSAGRQRRFATVQRRLPLIWSAGISARIVNLKSKSTESLHELDYSFLFERQMLFYIQHLQRADFWMQLRTLCCKTKFQILA